MYKNDGDILKEHFLHVLKSYLAIARKERNAFKVGILSNVLASVHNKQIEVGRTLSNNEVCEVLAKERAKRLDAAEQYAKAGVLDRAASENAEAEYISIFLPKDLTHAEVMEIALGCANTLLEENQPVVMGTLMKKVREVVGTRYPGSELAKVVKSVLP
jgi:uncharacterized protein